MFLQLLLWLRLATQIAALYLWYGKSIPFYNRLLQLLRNDNILFTKIFQSLANSNGYHLNPDLRSQLQHYTANTSYTESEINYELLDEIEHTYNVQIDRRVINSGMIALVFKGVAANGDPVIVKLKRNNIAEQLKRGCDSVLFLYRCVSRFAPRNIYVRILKPFIINIGDIAEQCDFDKEIANLHQAKIDFEPLPFIHIPTVHNTASESSDFILMDYIDGTHVLPPSTTEEERAAYMEKFTIFTSYAFLFNAIHHTDLHSGNIIFTGDGIGIVDYGMATQPSDEIHEIALSICEIIRDRPPFHEIDFIATFKGIFDPPLNKDEMTTDIIREVEDICISIAQPFLENMDVDELRITDNLMRLSACLKKEIVLNKSIYKIILGFSMMGTKVSIVGRDYPPKKLREIETRGLRAAYALIML